MVIKKPKKRTSTLVRKKKPRPKKCRRYKLTPRGIEKLETPAKGCRAIEFADTMVPGFHLVKSFNSSTYIFRYSFRGRRRCITIGRVGVISLAEARQIALQYKYLLAVHGKDPAEEKRRSLDTLSLKAFCKTEFINHIQSKCKDHNESVRKMNVDLYPYFKGRLLSEISTGDIIRYINRIKKRSSGATANRHLALLSAIYSYAIKLGYIDQSPVKSVDRYQESTGMERFLSDSEIKKLVAALKLANSPVAAAAILLLLATGLRKGECLSLRWSCVDFERQQLKLTMDVTKGGRARTVILSSTAIKILEDLMQYRVDSSDFLFPGAKPGHHLTDVRKTLNTACKRAGINHVRTHDLRHSFCSKLASSGVSLLIIARLVGHRNLKTTERYSHLSEQCLVDANNIMSDALVAA